ncbi:hypothetical protein [Halomonas sp. BC04]|uniref:hypothetical protein n=1 Tax=Halomonas sp. BC04 TaxID=1403540 RepID=UPI000685DCD3|nr:hypothetical protein [Halomonas sp. BC04]
MLPLPLPPLSRSPAPSRLIHAIDARVHLTLKRNVIEPVLNRTFTEPLEEGEFDALEGLRITLNVDDLGVLVTLILENSGYC